VTQVDAGPLRGRQEQLDLLDALIHDCRTTGSGAVVLVEGNPGVGKTGLLRAVGDRARGQGFVVGHAGPGADDQLVPMDLLLAALFDGAPPIASAEERNRLAERADQGYWLHEELRGLLVRAADRSPVLYCLDDVQWADPASLTALRRLAGRLTDHRVLWLVALRPDTGRSEVRGTVEALRRTGAHHLWLAPLVPEAAQQLVDDLAGAPASPALRELAEQALGSPFLLVELMLGLREESLLTLDDGTASVRQRRLPTRLRNGMRERLSRLAPEAQTVARTAAALARRFSVDQLAEVLDRPAATLVAPVEELLAADLFTEAGTMLAYRHDLLREAVRDNLPTTALHALQRGRATGSRRRPAPVRATAGWSDLTPAEVAVVRQVVGGLTNREVAERLFLSPHTVSSHLRHAFLKVGVTSRMQLARSAAGHHPGGTVAVLPLSPA
jgi:DNA-binding CsgD family transcriptional regulator